MSRHVFISHSHKDAKSAQSLLSALEARGIRCWIAPRDVPAGGSYAEALLTAIEDSCCFVLVYSEHANVSSHVLREVERALNFGVNVIPVRFDTSKASRSLDFLLATVNWLSAITPPDDAMQAAVHQIAASIPPQDVKPTDPIDPAKPTQLSEGRGPSRTWLIPSLCAAGVLLVLLLFGAYKKFAPAPRPASEITAHESPANPRELRDAIVGPTWLYHWHNVNLIFAFEPSGETKCMKSWPDVKWSIDGAREVTLRNTYGSTMHLVFTPDMKSFTTTDWDGQPADGKILKSYPDGAKLKITFVNKSTQTLKCSWIDYGGQPREIAKLVSGSSNDSDTATNNAFMISDADDNVWNVYVLSSQDRVIEIADH